MKGDALLHMMPKVATGHIIGQRAWRVGLEDGKPRLFSITACYMWRPKIPASAKIPIYDDIKNHFTCDPRSLGIFAAKKNDMYILMGLNYGTTSTVVGEVALWGQIVEHSNGYRAQYAYPLSIGYSNYRWPRTNASMIINVDSGLVEYPVCHITESILQSLCSDYGVPKYGE